MTNTIQLRQDREVVTAEMRDAVTQEQTFRAAGDTVKAGEQAARFAAAEARHADLTGQINRQEALNEAERLGAERFLETEERSGAGGNRGSTAQRETEYREAFSRYFQFGMASLEAEQRQILGRPIPESRAQSTTNSAGGYTVPQDFMNEIERSILDFSGVMQAARIVRTATGAALPWPTSNATARKATIVSENSTSTPTDFTFGQKSLGAYTYRDMAAVSEELLQDSAFDLGAFISNEFGESFGRALNEHFTTGDDSGKPNGVVTASTLGKTAASTTAFTRLEIIDLVHSVDPGYRRSRSAGFMMHDKVLAEVKKLSLGSGDASPLWQQSMRDGAPDTIDGFRYFLNQDMDSAMTTGKKLFLFGDFNKYVIRQVLGLTIRRLEERFADSYQVGFIGFARYDGELMNTAAVKHLKLA